MFDAYEDKESERIEAGDHIGIYDLDVGKIGVVICYDIRFSEYIRTLALKGIDFLMVPAAFYRPRTDDWEVLLRAASLYNIMYVCAANQFGKRCAGRSSVADPDGRIVEMIELKDHPYFLATQAHPEFKSRPGKPHPLFKGFIKASGEFS